jgi:hypothetical protein
VEQDLAQEAPQLDVVGVAGARGAHGAHGAHGALGGARVVAGGGGHGGRRPVARRQARAVAPGTGERRVRHGAVRPPRRHPQPQPSEREPRVRRRGAAEGVGRLVVPAGALAARAAGAQSSAESAAVPRDDAAAIRALVAGGKRPPMADDGVFWSGAYPRPRVGHRDSVPPVDPAGMAARRDVRKEERERRLEVARAGDMRTSSSTSPCRSRPPRIRAATSGRVRGCGCGASVRTGGGRSRRRSTGRTSRSRR